MANLNTANELVIRAETRRLADSLQTPAQGLGDPNAAPNPAAVGVPCNGAKTVLIEAYPEAAPDAGSLRVWVWRKPRAAGGAGWTVPADGDLGAVAVGEGRSLRLDVTGFNRVFVQVYDAVAGGLAVVYGVGVLE
jgi:hypothetical protein